MNRGFSGVGSGVLLIYGAGSAGVRIARRAQEAGLQVVLSGRRENAVRSAAEKVGVPWRIADSMATGELDRALEGTAAVVNAAGPFSATAELLAGACIRNRTHYIDLSNEFDAYRDVWALSQDAAAADVTLVPGAGMGTAAAEAAAAHALADLPDADRLVVVRSSSGGHSAPGVKRTTTAVLARRPVAYRAGTAQPVTARPVRLGLPSGMTTAVPVATGDLEATALSSGVADVSVFFATDTPYPLAAVAVPALRMLSRLRSGCPASPARRIRGTAGRGGTHQAPAQHDDTSAVSHVWVTAANATGQRSVSRLDVSGSGTDLSARVAVAAVVRVLTGTAPTGAITAGSLLGTENVLSLAGVSITKL